MNLAQQIKDKINIEDIVATDNLDLKPSGANFVGKCPFHQEKTSSFRIYTGTQTYKCFGCGVQGDVLNYVQERDGIDFKEALKKLAKEAGIQLKELSEDEKQELNLKNSVQIFNSFAEEFFLSKGPSLIHSYCKSKGISEETKKLFRIGYWPKEETLLKAAKEALFTVDIIEQSGLLNKKKTDLIYDGRIVFPIHDQRGAVIAFSGRSLSSKEECKSKGIPKYINSSNNPSYIKSETLYGFHLAKKMMRQTGTAYLCEGYTDVIAMHQNGIENCIATCGTDLFEAHVKQIARFATTIVLMRDGDKAGQKASLRDIDLILAAGLKVQVVELPKGKDPGDYMEDGDTLSGIIADRIGGINYKADKLITKNLDIADRRDNIASVAKTIAIVSDNFLRNLYIKEIAKKKKLVVSDLRYEVNSYLDQNDEEEDNVAEIYFRAGTQYYAKLESKNAKNNLTDIVYQKWDRATLKEDYGESVFTKINKYWGTTFTPCHGEKYQQVVNGYYNFYAPLLWEAKPFSYKKGTDLLSIKELKHSMSFLFHIAGHDLEKFIILIDYIQILYLYPSQALPILLLISTERNTGKSTFLEWMRFVFSSNMTFCESHHLAGQFNSDWVGKLLIACEELKLSDRADVQDRIKTYSTGTFLKSEGKGTNRVEVVTTPHFMFATNRWDSVKIEDEETRFYPLHIPIPKTYNRNLKEDLKNEIPYLFHLFQVREIYHKNVDRCWFDPKLLQSGILDRIKEESRSWMEKDIRAFIRKAFMKLIIPSFRMNYEYVSVHVNNYKNAYGGAGISYNANSIHKFLNAKFNKSRRNTTPYNASNIGMIRSGEWTHVKEQERGRHYEFKVEDFFSTEELNALFTLEELKTLFPELSRRKELGLKEVEPKGQNDDLPF